MAPNREKLLFFPLHFHWPLDVSVFASGGVRIKLNFLVVSRLALILDIGVCFPFQLVLPEYALHVFFNVLFLFAYQWGTLLLNLPLIIYHIHRCVLLLHTEEGILMCAKYVIRGLFLHPIIF